MRRTMIWRKIKSKPRNYTDWICWLRCGRALNGERNKNKEKLNLTGTTNSYFMTRWQNLTIAIKLKPSLPQDFRQYKARFPLPSKNGTKKDVWPFLPSRKTITQSQRKVECVLNQLSHYTKTKSAWNSVLNIRENLTSLKWDTQIYLSWKLQKPGRRSFKKSWRISSARSTSWWPNQ